MSYTLPEYDEQKYNYSFQEYWKSLKITADNVNRPLNSNEDTLLHYVCRYGTTQMLQELFHRSFYVKRHPVNRNKYQPIHEAAAYNNHEILKMLIRSYHILPYQTTDICRCHNYSNYNCDPQKCHCLHHCLLWHSQVTPLYIAAMKGHEESVYVLVKQGGVANIYTEQGWSVMNAAVYGGNYNIIRCIMELKPDYPRSLFSQNSSFKSFMGMICSYGQREMLDIIKQFWGQQINRWHEPLVYYAVRHRCSPEFLKYLLTHENVGLNQSPNDDNKDITTTNPPQTPLKTAMEQMDIPLIKILVEHGARVY